MSAIKRIAFVIVLPLWVAAASAEVRLPAIFGDHMVLQREAAAPVWGWAAVDEEISIALDQQTLKTKADGNGKWRVKFENLKTGGPYTLTIQGSNTVVIKDVLVGEVWL